MSSERPLILRRWASRIRSTDRADYARYVEDTGMAGYLEAPGNLGCELLMRDLEDGVTEVTTLSWWESIDAIRDFAGEQVDRARYYPEDDRFLLEKPDRVEHHEILVEGTGIRRRSGRQRESVH